MNAQPPVALEEEDEIRRYEHEREHEHENEHEHEHKHEHEHEHEHEYDARFQQRARGRGTVCASDVALTHLRRASWTEEHDGMPTPIASSASYPSSCSSLSPSLCMFTELLVGAGADPQCPDGEGKHMLFFAALMGRVDIIRLLLQARAHVNHADHYGRTALFFAAKHDHVSAALL